MKRFLLLLLISARVTAQTRALGISPLDGSGSGGSGVSGGTAGRFALFSGATTLTTDTSASFSGSGATFIANFNRITSGNLLSVLNSTVSTIGISQNYSAKPTHDPYATNSIMGVTGGGSDDWSNSNVYGVQGESYSGGTKAIQALIGVSGVSLPAASDAALGSAIGVQGIVNNFSSSSATVSNAVGVKAALQNNGTAITNGYGFAAQFSGAVANRYGLSVDNGGTATTLAYGVFIADQTASGAANSYNIYSDGLSARNWFEGPIHMGASTALVFSSATPTISSGFGSSPSVTAGMATAFRVNVGTGGAATTGVVALPTATTGWNCTAADVTNPDTSNTVQTASTTATASFKNYSRTTGAATAWAASDILAISCTAF